MPTGGTASAERRRPVEAARLHEPIKVFVSKGEREGDPLADRHGEHPFERADPQVVGNRLHDVSITKPRFDAATSASLHT